MAHQSSSDRSLGLDDYLGRRHDYTHLNLIQLEAYTPSPDPAADTVVLFLPTQHANEDAHLGVTPGTRRMVVTCPPTADTVATPTGLTVPSSVREVVLHLPDQPGAEAKARAWAVTFLRMLFAGMWRTGMRPKVVVVGSPHDTPSSLRDEVRRELAVQFTAESMAAAELGILPSDAPSGVQLDSLLGSLEVVGTLEYRERVGSELFLAEPGSQLGARVL